MGMKLGVFSRFEVLLFHQRVPLTSGLKVYIFAMPSWVMSLPIQRDYWKKYTEFAACILIQKANNIEIQNNTIDNCGYGLFTQYTSKVLVQGNYKYNNGNNNESGFGGNSWTEVDGMTFRYNLLDHYSLAL
jgi:nitrous oxidase accessory protein NosD